MQIGIVLTTLLSVHETFHKSKGKTFLFLVHRCHVAKHSTREFNVVSEGSCLHRKSEQRTIEEEWNVYSSIPRVPGRGKDMNKVPLVYVGIFQTILRIRHFGHVLRPREIQNKSLGGLKCFLKLNNKQPLLGHIYH